jgi:hypothetical protein
MSNVERKVKFPHTLVFKEVVKEGDSSEIVEFLKRPSVDTGIVNTTMTSTHGGTALHEFVRDGNMKCVRVLVNLGADVNLHDCTGWTPLHYSVNSEDMRITKFLLKHGADPDILSYDGKTPVDITDNFEMIELLMGHSGNL